MAERIFTYYQHKNKFDSEGTKIFECVAETITEADRLCIQVISKNVMQQPNVGTTVQLLPAKLCSFRFNKSWQY